MVSDDKIKDELRFLREKVALLESAEEEHRRTAVRAERLGEILENSINEIYIFNTESLNFIHVNRGGRENLGYSMEELEQLTPVDIKPDFTTEYFKKLTAPLQSGIENEICFTTVHQRKDNTLYPVEVHLQKSTFEGSPVFVAIILDITERKAAEEESQEKEEIFRSLVESTKGIVWEIGLDDMKFKYVSPQALEVTGYAPKEWLDFDFWLSITHPDDREWVSEFCETETAKGEDHEFTYRMVTKHGRVIWVRDIANIVKEKGRPVVLRGFIFDITEAREAEEALEASQKLLRTVLDTIPIRVFWKDKDLRYLGCNINFAEDAGLGSPDELTGKDDFQMSWRDSAELYRNDDRMVMRSGKPKLNYEEPQSRADGTLLWLETSKVPLRDKNGKVFGVLGTYDDITERKSFEFELEEAKIEAEGANKAKTAFLTTMSHEIRTPLSAIVSASETLESTELNEEQKRYVDVLKSSGDMLLRLINDILYFSKIESGQIVFEPLEFNVRELVEGLCISMNKEAEPKGIKLVCVVDDNVPVHLNGVGERVRDVLSNLVTNAVKYTDSGGKVSLKVVLDNGNKKPEEGEATALRFSVVDSGIGIAGDKINGIFDRFSQVDTSTTRMAGGTGLGLAISKRLVELMGGSIWVKSELGEGSTFSFIIPFEKHSAEKS